MCLQIIYIFYIYMYKEDLAWNNLQWLICHKTKQSSSSSSSCRAASTDILFRHYSLSLIASDRSSGLHSGIHRSTSLMSSSLLPQQCPACLVHLTWIVFVMGGRWPYNWCFVGCCLQDLFNKPNQTKPNQTTSKMVTQGQFSNGVQLVWIQSFSSPRLVALPRLENLVCSSICSKLGCKEMDCWLSEKH